MNRYFFALIILMLHASGYAMNYNKPLSSVDIYLFKGYITRIFITPQDRELIRYLSYNNDLKMDLNYKIVSTNYNNFLKLRRARDQSYWPKRKSVFGATILVVGAGYLYMKYFRT